MAQPIIDFGKAIPADVRSWARILRNINAFVSKVGSTFVLSEDTVFPVNESQVSGVRTFLPHPSMPPPTIESQIDAIRAFSSRPASSAPVNDTQAVLAARIFGA